MAELPSSVGLPQEMMLGHLDYSLPPDSRSMSIKVLPSNINTYQTSGFTVGGASATTYAGDVSIPSQNIIFDIPCGGSPSQFMDTRFTTLNFQASCAITAIGTVASGTLFNAYQRGGGYSWFDRMYVTSQNGQIIEDIVEFGMVNDTLVNLQMNHSARSGVANQYGFNPSMADGLSQGHQWALLSGTLAPATTQIETHSYSIPLSSAVIGVLSDKFLNVGRTSKLQIILQTSSILPITYGTNAAWTAGATAQVTLSNFSLQLEYVDIGINALQMLDQTLVDGKSYIHGVTYRTTSATLASSTGFTSLLAGIRASSVKSLFCRFVSGGAASTTNGLHGKYNSFNPLLNNINFNVGGVKYPQAPINPLLLPSQAFRETQMAIGSFNNAMFQSSIIPSQYCRLTAGGTVQSLLAGGTQEYSWNPPGVTTGQVADAPNAQSLFIFGENVEVCARRGLLSGLNCTSAPIFVEMNLSAAPTNSHTMYVIAMIDQVLIHDVRSGDIQVRV